MEVPQHFVRNRIAWKLKYVQDINPLKDDSTKVFNICLKVGAISGSYSYKLAVRRNAVVNPGKVDGQKRLILNLIVLHKNTYVREK